MALRRIVRKLLCFILPLIVLACLLEYKLSGVSNSYNKKRASLEQQADSIEVLVMGSSHAAFGIDPACFSRRGYNLANTMQLLFYDRALVAKNLKKLTHLKLAILPVSYFSLFTVPVDGVESWRDAYYKRFWGISYRNRPLEAKYYSYVALYGSEITKNIILSGFSTDLAENTAPNGFRRFTAIHTDTPITEKKGLARLRSQEETFSMTHVAENTDYLSDMIDELQRAGVRVVLITTPLCATYYRYEEPKYLSVMRSTIGSLCARYNTTYIDYTRDPRFPESEFYDNDHLNTIGARHFSAVLDSEIVCKAFMSVRKQ